MERKELRNIPYPLAGMAFLGFLVVHIVKFYSRKFLKWWLPFPILILLFLGYQLYLGLSAPPDGSGVSEKTIRIPRGSSLRQIAEILQEEELLRSPTLFVWLGRLNGYQHQLKAGVFRVPTHLSAPELLKYLTHPKPATIKVTFPEGEPLVVFASIVQQRLGIDSAQFVQLATDPAFCRELGISASSLEGYLLPETYFFPYDITPEEILRHLVHQTLKIFKPDSIQQQMARLGMNMHQILTLASIIEGEAMVDSERVLISSVYHNRLKRGWLLQADPTIQYLIPGRPRRLLLKDLEIDSPYNTYKYPGLPPGPINNPGKRSIMAALYPANTSYMYFVATGDGGHHFSTTAKEHAYWKKKFDQVRRQVRRQRYYRK